MRRSFFLLTLAALAAASPTQAEEPQHRAPVYQAPTSSVPEMESSVKLLKDSGGISTSYLVTDAPLSADYVMGDGKAPLVMLEYASLSCPHCAHFSNTVLPELEKKYIHTGKMKYILRQFPLNEPALKGAMLLECVGAQSKEKYYVFAKVLFDAQNKWAFDGNYMTGLETIAGVGGLSRDQFHRCVNNTDREMNILKMKRAAVEDLKLPHTPYFFIGGEVYLGERNLESMSKFIDAKLAQAEKSAAAGISGSLKKVMP